MTGEIRSKRGKRVLAVMLLVVGAAIAASIGACSLKSHSRNLAFNTIQAGDTEDKVIERFGTQPSVRESPDTLFARYASQPCGGHCVERLWFENRLSLDTEAWSVELDTNRRVLKKSRWVSP